MVVGQAAERKRPCTSQAARTARSFVSAASHASTAIHIAAVMPTRPVLTSQSSGVE